jgi:hypothetical protein
MGEQEGWKDGRTASNAMRRIMDSETSGSQALWQGFRPMGKHCWFSPQSRHGRKGDAEKKPGMSQGTESFRRIPKQEGKEDLIRKAGKRKM